MNSSSEVGLGPLNFAQINRDQRVTRSLHAWCRRPFALPCRVPYRIDISCPLPDSFDLLVQLGALDVEPTDDGLAAIMPDAVTEHTVTGALGVRVTVSTAVSRDEGSVWLLRPRAVRIGHVLIASPEADDAPDALRLTDSDAFGTG